MLDLVAPAASVFDEVLTRELQRGRRILQLIRFLSMPFLHSGESQGLVHTLHGRLPEALDTPLLRPHSRPTVPQVEVWALRIPLESHQFFYLTGSQVSQAELIFLSSGPLGQDLWMLHLGMLRDDLHLGVPLLPGRQKVPKVEADAETAASRLAVTDEDPLQVPLASCSVHFSHARQQDAGFQNTQTIVMQAFSPQAPVAKVWALCWT
mmetsp:Transcript_18865/g.34626  ORF Transcript_18865/g.34626 Transcript_18865/m.34626 type:complete len:208 (+) Transcript_18865:127-750(+)